MLNLNEEFVMEENEGILIEQSETQETQEEECEESEFILDIVTGIKEIFNEDVNPKNLIKEPFRIDSDFKGEWALRKIKERLDQRDNYIKTCKDMIEVITKQYNDKIKQEEKQFKRDTKYLSNLLEQYFAIVPKKKSKTAESYKLPSATLKLNFPKPKFEQDATKLLKYVKDNYTEEEIKGLDLIKVEETARWGEIKKKGIEVKGESVVDISTGLIIEGVKALEQPIEFKIEFPKEKK